MKRREFVVKSGLASAGIVATTSALGAISCTTGFNKSFVNIAVIGTGGRGCGLIPLINNIDNLNVVAVCDVLPFRLEEGLAKTNNTAKAYTDYKEVLKDDNVDAVLISTPFSTHYEIAMTAIEAGKHVYCEKTLVKGLAEINKLVERVSASNLTFQTGHQYHSSRLYTHVVAMLKKGEIGNIKSFECQWYRKGDWRKPVAEPKYERAINWRMYKEYSGGMTAELSSHQIDFVGWVLDENPKKIMGTGGIDFWQDGRETFDNTHLIFEYPSGVKAHFKCLTSYIPGGYQIKVIGDKGTITLTTGMAWINYYKKPEKSKLTDVDGVSGATAPANYIPEKGMPIKVEHLDPSKQALIDFKDAVIGGTQPISNLETGANTAKAVQLALDAMYNEKIQYWQ
ncbi:Gfo/Idh/MocA family protein [Seonamhaeicola marinus]|uniref:Gfo/Idh/MocA family oxidoreductase n=1 Tax=Seonamhaeicola marinus TaxID=1912246 RepID=A0A5D0ILK5_9FLAO|nr:Gfo/Idh/MocA family oxidoreductase [Seonamhaeicola marinus]TYA84396.1 Gfo/Idh/MocA family oxidoreductase [Seonamhaeicola marinus]